MLFAEVVEHGLAVSRRSVKRALRRLGCAVVVFHVVGKNHELGDVDETAEFGIFRAFAHALPLFADAAFVVGLFDFDKDQRHAVYQQGNVGAEFFIAVDAGQFSYNVEAVVIEILEVDQLLAAGLIGEAFVKFLPQIFVIQLNSDVGQQTACIVR